MVVVMMVMVMMRRRSVLYGDELGRTFRRLGFRRVEALQGVGNRFQKVCIGGHDGRRREFALRGVGDAGRDRQSRGCNHV